MQGRDGVTEVAFEVRFAVAWELGVSGEEVSYGSQDLGSVLGGVSEYRYLYLSYNPLCAQIHQTHPIIDTPMAATYLDTVE
jgi:hypothetical protein